MERGAGGQDKRGADGGSSMRRQVHQRAQPHFRAVRCLFDLYQSFTDTADNDVYLARKLKENGQGISFKTVQQVMYCDPENTANIPVSFT